MNMENGEHATWDKELKFLIFVAVPTQVFSHKKFSKLLWTAEMTRRQYWTCAAVERALGSGSSYGKISTVEEAFEAHLVFYMCIF